MDRKSKCKNVIITITEILVCIFLLSSCGIPVKKQEILISGNTEVVRKEESENVVTYPVYEVESIDTLHIGENIDIKNYYIRNDNDYPNHYYIDSDNVLWGYGDNQYVQEPDNKETLIIKEEKIEIDDLDFSILQW
jgi:hypothetical protein